MSWRFRGECFANSWSLTEVYKKFVWQAPNNNIAGNTYQDLLQILVQSKRLAIDSMASRLLIGKVWELFDNEIWWLLLTISAN